MGRRKILLRFDDICPTMNWGQWERAKLLLDKADVKPLLGVIPDCHDPELMIDSPRQDFWSYVRSLQDQGYTIAMHGYQHIFQIKADGLVTKNKISEFAGLSYEEQMMKIKKGKQIFEDNGINTVVFFAPAHSYDDNTLKALSSCGFKYISDGLSNRPYSRYGITLLPCRSGGIPSMRFAGEYFTAVVHAHEWEKKEKEREWCKYKSLLESYGQEIVSFAEFCQWKKGNGCLQRISERSYMVFRDYILPVIRRLK